MEIPVFVEPVAGNGYVATSGEPVRLSAEGATEQEALAKLQAQLSSRLNRGGRMVQLEVGPSSHPLAKFAGMFANDPDIGEWENDVAEYRRQVDADADRP